MRTVRKEPFGPIPKGRIGSGGADDNHKDGYSSVKAGEDRRPSCRLLDSNCEHHSDDEGEKESQEIDIRVKARNIAKVGDAEVAHSMIRQIIHRGGKCTCISGSTDHVFEHQIPTNNKRKQFADRVIGVGVC